MIYLPLIHKASGGEAKPPRHPGENYKSPDDHVKPLNSSHTNNKSKQRMYGNNQFYIYEKKQDKHLIYVVLVFLTRCQSRALVVIATAVILTTPPITNKSKTP